jgi:hypothetical protein
MPRKKPKKPKKCKHKKKHKHIFVYGLIEAHYGWKCECGEERRDKV